MQMVLDSSRDDIYIIGSGILSEMRCTCGHALLTGSTHLLGVAQVGCKQLQA